VICCPLCASTIKTVEIGGRDRLVCISCEFVHWDNPKPVTATLVPLDGGIVLVKRKFEPYVDDWCLPGGFIEGYESPNESAAREVLEETGLTISGQKLLCAHAPGRGINVIILFYGAETVSGDMVPGDDASDVGCFKQNELPSNIAFELHRRMVAQFFANKISPVGYTL
jgi:ADP-ribose pyrophosphatase YjhB (NUDIX family)